MTKAQEVEWLDNAIATLGPDTYLGAALAEERDSIIRDIRCDITPLWHGDLRKFQTDAREEMKNTNVDLEKLRTKKRELESQVHNLSETIRALSTSAKTAIEELHRLSRP